MQRILKSVETDGVDTVSVFCNVPAAHVTPIDPLQKCFPVFKQGTYFVLEKSHVNALMM